MKPPEFNYDDKTLRESPQNPEGLRQFILHLEDKLDQSLDASTQVSILGEIGVYLRILGQFDQAEDKFLKCLELIKSNSLGAKKEVQQKIRLAHVYQWKGDFQKSNQIFEKILSQCHHDLDAGTYLDFALQHAGKNLFDQEKYQAALECFTKALKVREGKNSPEDQIVSTHRAIQETKRRLGKESK